MKASTMGRVTTEAKIENQTDLCLSKKGLATERGVLNHCY